jgi:hypothetical protein
MIAIITLLFILLVFLVIRLSEISWRAYSKNKAKDLDKMYEAMRYSGNYNMCPANEQYLFELRMAATGHYKELREEAHGTFTRRYYMTEVFVKPTLIQKIFAFLFDMGKV